VEFDQRGENLNGGWPKGWKSIAQEKFLNRGVTLLNPNTSAPEISFNPLTVTVEGIGTFVKIYWGTFFVVGGGAKFLELSMVD